MKLCPSNVRKIAVFRALQLGDMLCAIPAIRALRAAYPDAEITLLGLPWAAMLLKRFPGYFDRFLHFPGYPGLPEQDYDENAFGLFLEKMKEEQFDLLLQMQGNGSIVNELVHQMGARYVAGFHNGAGHVDMEFFIPYPDYGSEVQRHLLLMNHLGISGQGAHLEFPLYRKDYEELENLLLPVTSHKYVVVHPGSRGSWRQWPPAYFALLADYMNQQGFIPVITGTAEEIDVTREVKKCIRHPHIDLTGQTSLGAMAALVKDAFFVISNCTGISHIAAAMQTPGIIISMDGEPHRWGHPVHRMIDWAAQRRLDKVILQTEALVEELKHRKGVHAVSDF